MFDPVELKTVSWRTAEGRGMRGLVMRACIPCLGTGYEMSGEAKMLLAILREATRK